MKKILVLALTVLLAVSALALTAFAAEEPVLTNDTKCYIGFNVGNNDYSGLTPDEAKKQLLFFEDNGAVSVLKDGGTMVAVGKLFIGGDYTLPELGSTLKITSNDGTTDYKNMVPIDNPYCAMKMAKGATLTLTSDVIVDDIILFQEHVVTTTFAVTNNSTLMINDNVISLGSMLSAEPMYMSIYVEAGSTAIVKGGTWQSITGEGEIVIADGVTVIESGEAAETTAVPAETTAAPVAGTEAPAETTAAPAETTEAVDGTEDPASTDAVPVETTAVESDSDEQESTAEGTDNTTASAETKATSADGEGNGDGNNSGPSKGTLIVVGVVVAVVVVAAVVVIVIKKKKA